MRIEHTQLIKKQVETKSGKELGKISDVVYDIDTYTIVQFVVSSGLLKSHHYRIHTNQIIAIQKEKIIVDDTRTPITAEEKEGSFPGPTEATPATFSQVE